MSTFVAIDFETAARSSNSACAVGLVRVENQEITQRFYALIQPPERQFEFTYVHGIHWHDVMNEPTFEQVWPLMLEKLEGAEFFVAHNASFDRRVLESCCKHYGIISPTTPFVCTVKLARKTWSLYPTKLNNVCDFLGIELEHHQALSDAEACAKIAIAAYSSS
ncbi:MAG: 3'-5' exonuclease [Cyanobacteria bacterium P01_F01_bin.42]